MRMSIYWVALRIFLCKIDQIHDGKTQSGVQILLYVNYEYKYLITEKVFHLSVYTSGSQLGAADRCR